MADYMRTNDYTLPQFKHVIDDFVAAGRRPRHLRWPFSESNPSISKRLFEEVRKQYGTIERYFSEAWGLMQPDKRPCVIFTWAQNRLTAAVSRQRTARRF